MTQLSDTLAKLVLAERERDAAREEALRYRDKLLECAKECSRCDGSGLVTISGGGSGDPEWDADDQPCPECADIRELLL